MSSSPNPPAIAITAAVLFLVVGCAQSGGTQGVPQTAECEAVYLTDSEEPEQQILSVERGAPGEAQRESHVFGAGEDQIEVVMTFSSTAAEHTLIQVSAGEPGEPDTTDVVEYEGDAPLGETLLGPEEYDRGGASVTYECHALG